MDKKLIGSLNAIDEGTAIDRDGGEFTITEAFKNKVWGGIRSRGGVRHRINRHVRDGNLVVRRAFDTEIRQWVNAYKINPALGVEKIGDLK